MIIFRKTTKNRKKAMNKESQLNKGAHKIYKWWQIKGFAMLKKLMGIEPRQNLCVQENLAILYLGCRRIKCDLEVGNFSTI